MTARTAANLPAGPPGPADTDGHVPRLRPIGATATPAGQVLGPAGAPARHPRRAAQARPGGGAAPEAQAPSRRRGRTGPPGPAAGSRRPQRRAGFEVIALAADETELREFLECSRPGAESDGVPMLPWRGNGVSPTAEASGRRPPGEAGILVLSPRGLARYALEQLTDREQDVLALMAEGRSNSGIASQLYVTEHTVEKHVKNIFAALRLSPSPGDHRRVLAVLIYLRAVAAG